jgi:DNA-binding transcriptional LysR family regulator
MTSASQLLAVHRGELDIAFLRNPPPNKRFQQRMVFQENFALVLPKNHWLDATNFQSMTQVANEKFILPTKTDGEIYHNLQWSICEDAGFSANFARNRTWLYNTKISRE